MAGYVLDRLHIPTGTVATPLGASHFALQCPCHSPGPHSLHCSTKHSAHSPLITTGLLGAASMIGYDKPAN